MGIAKMLLSWLTDVNGKNWETVGENIRYGAKGKGTDKYAIIDVTFGANTAEDVEIMENNTGLSDLVASGSGQFINFTSASSNIVNVVGIDILEADGAFRISDLATNSSAARAIYIESSSAGDTAQFKVWLKVDEY